jgi:hypothetical protein
VLALLNQPLVLCVILTAFNFICCYRSLSGYFLADDFVHIPYLARVFDGHPELLLDNFHSNWMHTSGTQFYRPLISITLAVDYLVAGVNPFVYHLSNLLFQTAATVFLFLFAVRLLAEFGIRQARLSGFLVAALFAACPLHSEVISWVIGRVDSVCTAFLLASLWLFVKGIQTGSKRASALSLVAFALSLMSKEMAVTLPPTLTLLCLCAWPVSASLKDRVVRCVRQTWPFWLLLFIYLAMRVVFLGTLTGGYSGSVGEGLSASFTKRFFESGAYYKLLFPLNCELFNPGSGTERNLKMLYLLTAVLATAAIALRLWSASAVRYIIFAGGWFVLALIPTYQVFNLSDSLFGSRFIYLATAPMALLLALLACPLRPAVPGNGWQAPLAVAKLMRLANVVLTACLVICFSSILYKNNQPWLEAGRQVRELKLQTEKLLSNLAPDQKLAILNVPQKFKGAHMIYNAAMLSVLLSKPLSNDKHYERVVTFEPINFGEPDLLVASRLRALVERPDKYSFYTWNSKERRLLPLQLTPSQVQLSKDGLEARPLTDDSYLLSPPLNLPSTATDFVDVYLSAKAGEDAPSSSSLARPVLILSWSGRNEALPVQAERRLFVTLEPDGQLHRYRFNVSEHKSWIMSEQIGRVKLEFPFKHYQQTVSRIVFSNGRTEIAVLKADKRSLHEAPDGNCYLNGSAGVFNYDASMLPGVKQVAVELSRPNSWFEHYTGTYRDTKLSEHALKSWRTERTKGSFSLAARAFPSAGYYQLRICGLSGSGEGLGYVSDPVNLQLDSGQISGPEQPALEFNAK